MTEPPTRKSSGSNRAQDIHRTPPHSVDAEQGVLGSMLISPGNTIAECVEKIDEEYFYVPAHRAIYTAMVDLWNAGQAIDLITFTQVLRDRKLLDLVGGAAFVTSLFGVVPTAANVGYYIDIVRDKYILRSIIAASTESVRRAYEEQDEVGNLLDEMESRIVAIRERNGSVDDLPAAVSVMTLAEREPDPSKTLLGNRFLGVGGGMIFIGPSGGGKSSASVQQDISWSLGRPAFGIHPSRPLRILGLNAENDDGDLSEMVRGVCDHLDLNAEEREAVRERVLYVSDCSHTGESFLRMVERLLKKYGPFDLVRIDVLLAYLGGDVLDVEVTSKFLRNGLNPILKKFGCAAIINHHTPKTTYRDTSEWKASDWMYSGAGNADITNWARAALVIDPTHAEDVFIFRAAKRGGRIGWCDDEGNPVYQRLFCWEKGGAIYWREATAEDAERVESRKPKGKRGPPKTKEDLKALVPLDGSVAKNVLIRWAQDREIGEKRACAFLAELIEGGDLFKWSIPRPRTNPETRISRHEQRLV